MKNILNQFPTEVRADIASIYDNNGVLTAKSCQRVCDCLSINIESLMIQLLPVAANYAKAPVSSFQVGAVVKGKSEDNGSGEFASLYLGANFEFKKQALCHSVHAEQSAVSNAWLHNEPGISAIATSAAPCGHCRQFLYELAGNKPLPVLMPTVAGQFNENFNRVDLSQLLPSAFGPLDLGCERVLMEPDFGTNQLQLIDVSGVQCQEPDELTRQALDAANYCYAPYTQNFVGCAILLNNGNIFTGRYAENAAHNPSLSAFSAALCGITMNALENKLDDIKRVVMVEHVGQSCQREVTQILLASINRNISLEYYPLVIKSS